MYNLSVELRQGVEENMTTLTAINDLKIAHLEAITSSKEFSRDYGNSIIQYRKSYGRG